MYVCMSVCVCVYSCMCIQHVSQVVCATGVCLHVCAAVQLFTVCAPLALEVWFRANWQRVSILCPK